MGLDALLHSKNAIIVNINGENIDVSGGVRIGAAGWGHSLRFTIGKHLESGMWGLKYPLLQNHSDCEGDYTPEQSASLLAELLEIKEKLKKVKYPKYDVLLNSKIVETWHQYGEDFDEINKEHHGGLNGNQIYGFGVGVDGHGIIVVYKNKFLGFFKEIKGRGREAWGINHKGEKIILNIDDNDVFDTFLSSIRNGTKNRCHIGTLKKVVFGYDNAYHVFDWTIENLIALAENSVKHKVNMVFC